MYRILYSFGLLLNLYVVHGQTTFSVLPDVGGINRQAMGILSVPEPEDIIIMGHRFDTILPGSNAKPYLAHFSYDGELKFVVPIVDSLYEGPFSLAYPIPPYQKNDSIYYFEAIRDIGDPFLRPYLTELNINTGKILRSIVLLNLQHPLLPNEPHDLNYTVNNEILLLSSLINGDSVQTYITLLDSAFNEVRLIKVKDVSKKTFASICNKNLNGTFDIVGYCLVEQELGNDYDSFYLDIVDGNGNVLEHTLAPKLIPISRGVYFSRTILQDKSNNWIIGGTFRQDLPDISSDCYELIPYIFSTTPDFKTLRWQTKFFDVPYYGAPQYFLHSMTQVEDGFIVSGEFYNYNGFDNGVLFKASDNGDSLWMKHYIPLNWNEDRVGSVRFTDIQTSPYGTIIVTGAVGDFQENIIRPWILQLDKDGCLVPDCNAVGTHHEDVESSQENFTIFPNPASTEIYVLSHISSAASLTISIFSIQGIEIKKRSFDPRSGYQYALPVNDLDEGLYFLVVTDPKSGHRESHQFIRK